VLGAINFRLRKRFLLFLGPKSKQRAGVKTKTIEALILVHRLAMKNKTHSCLIRSLHFLEDFETNRTCISHIGSGRTQDVAGTYMAEILYEYLDEDDATLFVNQLHDNSDNKNTNVITEESYPREVVLNHLRCVSEMLFSYYQRFVPAWRVSAGKNQIPPGLAGKFYDPNDTLEEERGNEE